MSLSKEVFLFEKGEEDDVLRVCGCHQESLCKSTIWFSRYFHRKVFDTLSQSFARPPSKGDRAQTARVPSRMPWLPLELWREVLLQLDLRSLIRFRQTCLAAHQLPLGLREYHASVRHAPTVIMAILRTTAPVSVTLADLFATLCTEHCAVCRQRFAGFVFLPTWTRCCYDCITTAPQCKVVDAGDARKCRLIPSKDSPLGAMTPTLVQWPLPARKCKTLRTYANTVVSFEHISRMPRASRYLQRHINPDDSLRAVCPLPYYDAAADRAEHGVTCVGCLRAYESNDRYQKKPVVFSRQGLLGHVRFCEEARELWAASWQGKYCPGQLPQSIWPNGTRNIKVVNLCLHAWR